MAIIIPLNKDSQTPRTLYFHFFFGFVFFHNFECKRFPVRSKLVHVSIALHVSKFRDIKE